MSVLDYSKNEKRRRFGPPSLGHVEQISQCSGLNFIQFSKFSKAARKTTILLTWSPVFWAIPIHILIEAKMFAHSGLTKLLFWFCIAAVSVLCVHLILSLFGFWHISHFEYEVLIRIHLQWKNVFQKDANESQREKMRKEVVSIFFILTGYRVYCNSKKKKKYNKNTYNKSINIKNAVCMRSACVRAFVVQNHHFCEPVGANMLRINERGK